MNLEVNREHYYCTKHTILLPQLRFNKVLLTVNSLVINHPWCTKKWSLWGGGRLPEVVAKRELTVLNIPGM